MARKLSRKKRAIYYRKYRRDPNIKIKETLNRLLRHLVKGKVCPKIVNLLGCGRDEFIRYIEGQFKDGMDWANYGKYWDLDHIIPCCSFNLLHENELHKCFNYKNFRPLNSKTNKLKLKNDLTLRKNFTSSSNEAVR